ncbi:MAG: leucyl/phenylalanyl-tRNA--protein transferase [Magnetococcales bacterium]|nr:leucyl/phenylalanyl-tRNA--protein transferase [Magnetococcales bacterium]
MPVFRLPEEPLFPPVAFAEPNGLLAVGGDLTPRRLLAAYRNGIFPWYSPGEPLLWWSPHPRMVLKPEWLHIPRSLRKTLRQGRFHVTLDRAFPRVIAGCAAVRRETGTWITSEMEAAYGDLHRLGHAHSAEAWSVTRPGMLVGGVYGVAIGGCFFGESMFHLEPEASKCAFAVLMEHLRQRGFSLVDCQMNTHHLARFGAREVPRTRFMADLDLALSVPIPPGPWAREVSPAPSDLLQPAHSPPPVS